VADDLARLTDGAIQLDLSSFAFAKVMPVVADTNKKKKRK